MWESKSETRYDKPDNRLILEEKLKQAQTYKKKNQQHPAFKRK